MFDTAIFDSRDSRCKTPFGAVSAGTYVKLTIHPLRQEGFSHAQVALRYELPAQPKFRRVVVADECTEFNVNVDSGVWQIPRMGSYDRPDP